MGVVNREIDAFTLKLSRVGKLQWQAAHNVIVATQTTIDRRSDNTGTRRVRWAYVIKT